MTDEPERPSLLPLTSTRGQRRTMWRERLDAAVTRDDAVRLLHQLHAESVDDRLSMAEAVAYLEEARRRWANNGLDTLADVAAAIEPAWALDRDRMRPDPRRQFSVADRVRDLIARLGAMDAVTMAEMLEVPVEKIAVAALGNVQAHRLRTFMDACDLDVPAVAELWHVSEHEVRGWLEGAAPDQGHAGFDATAEAVELLVANMPHRTIPTVVRATDTGEASLLEVFRLGGAEGFRDAVRVMFGLEGRR